MKIEPENLDEGIQTSKNQRPKKKKRKDRNSTESKKLNTIYEK